MSNMSWFCSDDRVLRAIEASEYRTNRALAALKEAVMAISTEVRELINTFNAATNDIAVRIDALIAAQDAGGMSADDEAAAVAELRAISARLQALGSSSDNPVPPVVLDPDVPVDSRPIVPRDAPRDEFGRP